MKMTFLLAATFLLPLSLSAEERVEYSSDPSKGSGIGYNSVNEALIALKQKEGVSVRVERGWTLVDDRKDYTLWSFTPDGHPAHPAVVKRAIIEKDGVVGINMKVHCEASKKECDHLAGQFHELNERMKRGAR